MAKFSGAAPLMTVPLAASTGAAPAKVVPPLPLWGQKELTRKDIGAISPMAIYLYSTGLRAPSPQMDNRGAGRNLLEQILQRNALHIFTAQVSQPQALGWSTTGLEGS